VAPLLPAGYAFRRVGRADIVARADALEFVVEAIRADGSLYGRALRSRERTLQGGRGHVVVFPAPGGPWAVRHAYRGGAVARVLGDRYVATGSRRPFHELLVSEALRARGVATPTVHAAVVYGSGAWYRSDVATAFIADATDLASLTLGADAWPDGARGRAWAAAGALLRTAFEAGLLHPDLNLRNIIVRKTRMQPAGAFDAGDALLLDLDRARVTNLSAAARARMLARFHRSRRKLELATGQAVGAVELQAFEAELEAA
jgi:3-deoxy-D-manno-octulosonic acid kinase